MSAEPATIGIAKKPKTRIRDYIIILAFIGAIIAAAYYGEEISTFFRLRMWDRGAPGRVVVGFLKAAQKQDLKAANEYVRSQNMSPLKKNERWDGYVMVVMSARMEILFEDFLPKDEPSVSETEFINGGKGAALVSVPNSNGRPVKYRLEMKDDGWKITDIRAGHAAAQEKPPVAGQRNRRPTARPR